MILKNLRLIITPLRRFAEANAKVALSGNVVQRNVLSLSKQKLMKESMLLLVVLFIFTSVTLKAQSPQKINFQSIVRNTNGVIFSNKTLSIKISLLSDSITGAQVYSETHSSTTDAIGLVSLQIGSGTALSGSFATINWGNAAHFIKLEADFNGGNNYVLLGTQELMSVPYAMYASKTDTNSLNLTNRFAAKLNKSDFPSGNNRGEFMYWNGDYWTILPPGQRGQSIIIDQEGNPTWDCLIPNTVDTTMSNLGQTFVVNTPITPITIRTTGVTGIGNSLLPQGLVASWSANVITITGTPTQVGFSQEFSVYLRGSCGAPIYVSGLIDVINATVPDAPTGVVATAGDGSASVAFVAPTNNGGFDITNYRVTSTPGGFEVLGGTSPITVNYLTNGTPYKFTVVAENLVGKSVASAASAAVTPAAVVCPDANITYNSYTYNTVGIGNQCWMAENLRTRKYNDETEIRFDTSGGPTGNTSQTWAGNGLNYGAYTIYAHDSLANPSNLTSYGYLYNWYAAKGIITDGGTSTKNICPTGWHVPTDSDWSKLIKSIDSGADTTYTTRTQSTTAGGKMKSTSLLWNSPNTGADNASGFTALPGGYRKSDGNFNSISSLALFWSTNKIHSIYAWFRALDYNDSGVDRDNSLDYSILSSGASVRCLKD